MLGIAGWVSCTMVMMDMDVFTTVLFISKACTKVLQAHRGYNSPNFVDQAPNPKTEDCPTNAFLGLSDFVFSLCFSLHFLLLFVLVFLKTYPHTKQGSAQPRHAAHQFLSRCKMCNSPLVGLVMNSCIFRSLGFAVCNP